MPIEKLSDDITFSQSTENTRKVPVLWFNLHCQGNTFSNCISFAQLMHARVTSRVGEVTL